MLIEAGEGGIIDEKECLGRAFGTRRGHTRRVGRKPTTSIDLIPNQRPSKSSQSQTPSQSEFDAYSQQMQQYNQSLATCIPNFQPPPIPNFFFSILITYKEVLQKKYLSTNRRRRKKKEKGGKEEEEREYYDDDG